MIYFFIILSDYRLRHLVNNVAKHTYTHDYIRMEITVLYLKISRYQLEIWWSHIEPVNGYLRPLNHVYRWVLPHYWQDDVSGNQLNLWKNISCYFNRAIDTVKITPLNRQLMSWNFQIQYSCLHFNVIMCIVTLLTRWC